MDLKYIHYIQAIAKHKNISSAAKELYISQPTLSQCLKKYEEELGYPIFSRTKQGLLLTREGEIFLNTARQMQNLERSMKNQLNDTDASLSGSVVFGLSSRRVPFLLPIVLPAFQKKYPQITVTITEGRTKDLSYSLMQGNVDVGFLIPPLLIDIPCHIFSKEEIFLAVPKKYHTRHLAHPKADSLPWVHLSDFSQYPFLLYDDSNRLHDFTNELFLQESFHPKETTTFHSVVANIRLAAAGMGITVIPEMLLEPHYELDYYSIGPEGCFRSMALGYPPHLYRSHPTELFSKFLMETIIGHQKTLRAAYTNSP